MGEKIVWWLLIISVQCIYTHSEVMHVKFYWGALGHLLPSSAITRNPIDKIS